MKHGTRLLFAALGLVALSLPASAGPEMPVFGPEGFELTDGEAQTFVESFVSGKPGQYVLHLINGDAEGNQVAAATVAVNGKPIVVPGDVTADTAGVKRPLLLQAGDNEMVVHLEGATGSFVTILVSTTGEPPAFVSGRLLLPWGRNDEEHLLTLALKNDSKQAPRAFKVLFYGPGGKVLAVSEQMALPPRGSLSFPVANVIAEGDWQAGSLEIHYTGPGRGRLFGSARQVDLAPVPQSEALPLVQAGFAVTEGKPSVGRTTAR